MKECEVVEDLNEEGFEELEEQDLAFGQWLRASSVPKIGEEAKTKESSSSICNNDFFNISSSHSRCELKGKDKMEEQEVQQDNRVEVPTKSISNKVHTNKAKCVDVETVGKSLGAVAISTEKKYM